MGLVKPRTSLFELSVNADGFNVTRYFGLDFQQRGKIQSFYIGKNCLRCTHFVAQAHLFLAQDCGCSEFKRISPEFAWVFVSDWYRIPFEFALSLNQSDSDVIYVIEFIGVYSFINKTNT